MCNLSGQQHTPILFYMIICFKLECYDYKSAQGRACSMHGKKREIFTKFCVENPQENGPHGRSGHRKRIILQLILQEGFC